jgi:hypothetical protein
MADLGKGQSFAAGIMGKLLNRVHSHPVHFVKEFRRKVLGRRILGGWIKSGHRDGNAIVASAHIRPHKHPAVADASMSGTAISWRISAPTDHAGLI